MRRLLVVGTVVAVALVMATSLVAFSFLGGVGSPDAGPDALDGSNADAADGSNALGETHSSADEAPLVSMEPTATANSLSQGAQDAVEAGVNEGAELAQEQDVEVTQEQRDAAVEGATESAANHEDADAEQIRAATKGAVHGSLLQAQTVEVEQYQAAVTGSVDGALAQYQTVNVTQLQSATWGAAHGGLAQHQVVEAEQIQVATQGAAAGAASEAGEKGVSEVPKMQEAAQGSAYGALEQYQKITVEQRQQVTVEHLQHAAAGASAGALEGTTTVALEQDQRITIEQRQTVTIKQVQKAATGAAKGALVQRQAVTVEQTQLAARGAGTGPLKQVQIAEIEQYQRITITQIQEASFGAAKGAIIQSQEATVEQIQAAADGASSGVLLQYQEVTITQVQKAATGAAQGSVTGAIQHQVVEVEQIQAAAFGAGEGAVTQRQVVSAIQVQKLAEGASGGVLVQHQEITIEQTQRIASGVCQETARAIQYQRISITQTQIIAQETATDAGAQAIAEGIDDEVELSQLIEVEVVQQVEDIDELEGDASLRFADQDGDGETVVVDAVDLSEGGFVAIYDGDDADLDPGAVLGASAYLSPGDHEDVEIALDEPLADDRSLVAAVHHDTTGDETFQYVETDGETDEPYVAEGGAPVLDDAFSAVEDPDVIDSAPEAESALEVVDYAIVGDDPAEEYVTLQNVANETLDMSGWTLQDRFDEGMVDTPGGAGPYEFPDEFTLEPDEEVTLVTDDGEDTDDTLYWGIGNQIWNESGDTVVVLDADGEILLESDISEELDDPEATLSVSDQEGDGETLEIEEANAPVEYVLTAEYDGETVESEPLDAGEPVTDFALELEPPIEDDTNVDVSVVATADNEEQNVEAGDVLESETIEYALAVEELEVEFLSCTQAEVSGTFQEGDPAVASTGFYDQAGFGNTIISDGVVFGEDVDAPFTGTVIFEVGDEPGVVEGDDEITVTVSDYGDFGTAITGLTTDSADYEVAAVTHGNPNDCLDEIRPALPTIDYEDASATDEGTIDVTFSYDNPNDAPLPGGVFEGTTADEPPAELASGTNEFTVEWTPETDDEQLTWTVDMTAFEYDEVLTAQTPPAGDLLPDEPEADDEPEEADDEVAENGVDEADDAPDDAEPEETDPEEAEPEDAEPEETEPDDAEPGDADPAEAEPEAESPDTDEPEADADALLPL